MGFFSWTCPFCGHSILNPHSIPDIGRTWLMSVTALGPDGIVAQGHYDGYGTVLPAPDCVSTEPYQIPWPAEPEGIKLMHTACWEALDKPGYTDIPFAKNAEDQGFFIDPEAYRLTLPQQAYDVSCIRDLARARGET